MKSAQLIKEFESSKQAEIASKASRLLRPVFRDAFPLNGSPLAIISDTGFKSNKVATMLSYAYFQAAQAMGAEPELILQKAKDRVTEVSPDVLKKLKTLPNNSMIMMAVSDRIGTLNGLGKSFRGFCAQRSHRFTSASSLGFIAQKHFNDVIDAHRIDYNSMVKKQRKLKTQLDASSEAHITTKAGTDLYLDITGSKAVFNHGVYKTSGTGGNLPAGEIYTPIRKRSAFGKLVIDLSSRQKDSTILCKEPINVYVEKGGVTKITGGKEAEGLKRTYDWAMRRAKFPWGVKLLSELGIGLNEKAKVIGATIVDEKAKGTAHIATGSNHWFGGDIFAIIHLDQVFNKPKIELDGKRLKI